MNIDISIYELRKQLTYDMNNSKLPLSVKVMVVKELYDAVSVVANQQLQHQLDSLNNTDKTIGEGE